MKIDGACVPILAVSLALAGTNDYPTEARADYVFVCMKTNGEIPDMLRRCSCSIDVIASLLPYDRYVAAQLRVRPAPLSSTALLNSTALLKQSKK